MTGPALRIAIAGSDVRIEAGAGPSRARLLLGKSPEAALRLMPLLFNLCPTAHTIAATLALGQRPSPEAGRLLAREILVEHALVMLRDWPPALGRAPSHGALAGLAALSEERLARLADDLFAMPAEEFLMKEDIGAIEPATPALAALSEVAGWPGGRVRFDGEDPTCFSRYARDRVIARAIGEHGASLAVRMFGRLREAAQLIADHAEARAPCRFRLCRDGSAEVEAPRGRLVHRATVEQGRICDYAVETPTMIMVGPGGFLERILRSALDVPEALREKALAIALSCANPCMVVEPVREAA